MPNQVVLSNFHRKIGISKQDKITQKEWVKALSSSKPLPGSIFGVPEHRDFDATPQGNGSQLQML